MRRIRIRVYRGRRSTFRMCYIIRDCSIETVFPILQNEELGCVALFYFVSVL